MFYATFDDQGVLSARYDSDVHGEDIPAGAVELDELTFWATMEHKPGAWKLVNGACVHVPPSAEDQLAEAKRIRLMYLGDEYRAAVAQPVTLTTEAGQSATFANTAEAIANAHAVMALDHVPGDTWHDVSGVPVFPFSHADLEALTSALAAHTPPSYVDYLTKTAAIRDALTLGEVEKVRF